MRRKKKALNLSEVAQDIYRCAEWLEQQGNRGERDLGRWGYLVDARHPHAARIRVMRDGILYYSAGWGWRCRKKPHWSETWEVNFAAWAKPPTPPEG